MSSTQSPKRTLFIGGNFKANGTVATVTELAAGFSAASYPEGMDVVIAPTAIHIPLAQAKMPAAIAIAAQNCFDKPSGAYTGELSTEILADMGVKNVITGHSERRHILKESDEFVASKTLKAIEQGMTAIFCIGELLEEREAGQTEAVCFRQMEAVRKVITPAQWAQVVIAYEPVWAIGTGKVASPEQAQEVHAALRAWLAENVSAEVAAATRIVYGGSVKLGN
eukprot:gnl/Ergobibamus_cyprinoides/2759.p2 GENE.gnl/Ergobibamus_cyprinoides/2759~~gnl/Ergobibamus_cyprinoides/2759.p2  ORF type:complete len:231 (+),score=139.41 gnl/Ergobibamus_cyprinoides/2759:22-693(+)